MISEEKKNQNNEGVLCISFARFNDGGSMRVNMHVSDEIVANLRNAKFIRCTYLNFSRY